MSDQAYERLADALDDLPGGFPRMPSGVELRLLKKAFTEEEAGLAGQMSRAYESVPELVARTGMPEAKLREVLRALVPRALVRLQVVEGQQRYRLGPFIVGWYEALMLGPMRTDVEFSLLFEQYMKEGGGDRILSPRPGVMGVVPARGSLKKELLQPCDDIDAHFARHERFAVFDCVCKLGCHLLGSSKCTKPVKRCGFVGLPPQTPLSDEVLDREQAMKLFAQIEEEGHVHTGFYGFVAGAESPQFVGCCNCCGDCCGILRQVNELGASEGPQRSNYRAVRDTGKCISCGTCLTRCQVKAIAEGSSDAPDILRDRCIGCGLCVITCPADALELEPVSRQEWFDIPRSFEEWEERRLDWLDRSGAGRRMT